MHIDTAVEEHVRDALGAVIDRNGDGMAAAMQGLSPEQMRHALGLGLFAVGYVVNDIHPDGVTKADLASLAREIVESESGWIGLDAQAVEHLLSAASKGDATMPGVNPADAMGLILVSGGHLLAAQRSENERWYEYLDEIWAALSAAPDPQTSRG